MHYYLNNGTNDLAVYNNTTVYNSAVKLDGPAKHDALVKLVRALDRRVIFDACAQRDDLAWSDDGPVKFVVDRPAAGSDVRGDRPPEPVQPATHVQRPADGGDGPGPDDLRRRLVDTWARWIFLSDSVVPPGIRGAADSLIKAIDISPARDRQRDGA